MGDLGSVRALPNRSLKTILILGCRQCPSPWRTLRDILNKRALVRKKFLLRGGMRNIVSTKADGQPEASGTDSARISCIWTTYECKTNDETCADIEPRNRRNGKE